jgi:hypothetical protein
VAWWQKRKTVNKNNEKLERSDPLSTKKPENAERAGVTA